MSAHDCSIENCSEKNEMKHLFLECSLCQKKCYFECFFGRCDFLDLMIAFGVIFKDEKSGRLNWSGNQAAVNKLKDTFIDDSMFSLTCLQCKKQPCNETTQTNEECMKQLIEKNDELNKELKEKMNIIENMTIKMGQLNKMDTDKIEKQNERNIKQIHGNLNRLIDEEMRKITNDMKAKINSEFGRFNVQVIDDDSNENEGDMNNGEADRQKKLDYQFPAGDIRRHMSSNKQNDKKNERQQNILTDKKVTFDDCPNIQPRKSVPLLREKPTSQIVFNENLQAAVTMNKQNQNKRVYELYVAKFKVGTQIDAIESHILNNTDIKTSDSFHIEQIMGQNAKISNPDYVAFKISMVKAEIYEKIKMIWGDVFTVRDFVLNKNDRTPMHEEKHNPTIRKQSGWSAKRDRSHGKIVHKQGVSTTPVSSRIASKKEAMNFKESMVVPQETEKQTASFFGMMSQPQAMHYMNYVQQNQQPFYVPVQTQQPAYAPNQQFSIPMKHVHMMQQYPAQQQQQFQNQQQQQIQNKHQQWQQNQQNIRQ